MLITPDKLKLAKYLDKGNRKHALDSLLFDQNKAIACNGHYLIQVEDTPPPREEFPVIKGMAEGPDYTPDKTLVTATTATKVLKNLPKSKNLPILNNALIDADKDGNVSFGLTDLDSSIVVRQRKEEGEYADADTFIRDSIKDEPKATAVINIKYLQKIVGALSEFLNSHETNRVEIALRGPENAIILQAKKDDATMITLIMPLRK